MCSYIVTRPWSSVCVNLKIVPDHGPKQDRGSVTHFSANPAGYHFMFQDEYEIYLTNGDKDYITIKRQLVDEARVLIDQAKDYHAKGKESRLKAEIAINKAENVKKPIMVNLTKAGLSKQ